MTTETFDKGKFLHEMAGFTGSETIYKHISGKYYTEGVRFVAKECGAYWLIDKILLNEVEDPFQVWKLQVNPDKTALLTVEDGNGHMIGRSESLDYTDFPLEEFTIWRIEGTALLPSEY